MKKKRQWIVWSVVGLVVSFALLGMSQVQGDDKPFMQVGDKIIYGSEDENGPKRKPIVNRETIANLELSQEQLAQIQAIQETLFNKYPEYEKTLLAISKLEQQLEEAKDGIEGWGRFKKEFEDSLAPIMTQEQLIAMHPGKGKGPEGKGPKGKGPKGKMKVHLDRLNQVELTDDQDSQISALLDEFDSRVTGLGIALKMEIDTKSQIRELEKSIEDAEDEYATLVSIVLTDAQIKELPMTGPPEHAGPPSHAKKGRD